MVVTGTLFIQAGALLSFHLEGRALLFTSGTELITERPLSIGNGGEAGHSDPHNREPGPILMCSADLALPSTKSNTNPSAQNQARTLASPSKPKTRISVNRSWALFSFAANRTIELSSGSNPRGEFIKIQEKRREGKRFILLPSGPRNDDVNLFFKALSFFVEKVTNATTSTTSSLRRSTTPFTAPQVSDPPMKLLCDTPSVHPPPIHSQSTAVETETPGLQSQTGEGDLSEENPSLGRVEDRGLDLEASGNNPLNPGFNSNPLKSSGMMIILKRLIFITRQTWASRLSLFRAYSLIQSSTLLCKDQVSPLWPPNSFPPCPIPLLCYSTRDMLLKPP
ncbi:unnamed protein product [Cuscuta campestris]|uniref:Uncharacterized protein n=1 Tax=Cuscuta campestris TaxID=132261 RepID=A0A484NMU9_9ASTE|nr:unnamed protein product [Cuscuta campestris]